MPRQVHIVQRGHNRQPVFVEGRDYEYYLSNLKEWKTTLGLAVYTKKRDRLIFRGGG